MRIKTLKKIDKIAFEPSFIHFSKPTMASMKSAAIADIVAMGGEKHLKDKEITKIIKNAFTRIRNRTLKLVDNSIPSKQRNEKDLAMRKDCVEVFKSLSKRQKTAIYHYGILRFLSGANDPSVNRQELRVLEKLVA